MEKKLDIIRKTRKQLLGFINDLTDNQLNEIPAGFNNNIIWNLGHIIAAQQGICYKRANLNLTVEEKLFLNYKPGSKPESPINSSEIKDLKEILFSSIDKFEADYRNNAFTVYPPWTTSFGAELNNIDNAADMILYHDGLHIGYIMALKKVVNK